MNTEADVPKSEQEAPQDAPPAEPTVDLSEGMAAAMAEGLKEGGAEVVDEPPALPKDEEEEGPEPEKEPAAADEPDEPKGEDQPKDEPGDGPSAEDEAKSLGVKNDKARERFVELRKHADELKALKAALPDLEEKATQYDQMLGHITSTGATPEQYQSALAYLNIVNKGSPEQLAQMRDTLMKEIEWIDGKIGRGGDALAAHDDLRQAVENGDIDRRYAEEIATQRNLKAAQEQHTQQQAQTAQQREQAQQQAVQGAREQLNALGARLQQTDPDYGKKVQQAMQAFQARMGNIDPSQWATEFLLDYQAVRLAPPPAKPPVGAVPMRSQGGGSMAKVATSMEEAAMLGLQAHAQGRG